MPKISWAATINAASCSFADVSAAITTASAGDTVTVPAGSCNWASQLNITKGIKLVGPGRDSLTITSDFVWAGSRTSPDDHLITYIPSVPQNNTPFDISGFTWDMNNLCGFLYIDAGSTYKLSNIRIFSNIIKRSRRNTFTFRGQAYGVIYQNTIETGTDTYSNISPYGKNATSWTNLSFTPGSADNIYLEDNIMQFHQTNNDGGLGGRIAVRYNTVTFTGSDGGQCFADAHGNQTGANLATMGTELYGNSIDWNNYGGVFFGHRGGIGIAFYNSLINHPSSGITINEEYADVNNPPATGPTGQPQHIWRSYYWRNYRNTTNLIITVLNQECCSGLGKGPDPNCCYNSPYGILENTDWFKDNTSFDGISGVGCGTLASRPATCTTGVGYWATDQSCSNLTGLVGANPATPISGTLYRCTAPNTWTVYYTPYPYPHPLRAEATPDTTPPAAKQGDLNNDGKVDVIDLGILLSGWGLTTRPPSDLNQDGRVDVIDLGILLSNWG